MTAIKHILVIRFSAMGDVAMTVPVLFALKKRYPALKLTVLTRPLFQPFFDELAEVVPVDLNGQNKGVKGLYSLSKELRRLNFDAIADLHGVIRSYILATLLIDKPVYRIDKGRREKKKLVDGKIFYPLKSTHQRYADVFKRMGFPLELKRVSLSVKVSVEKLSFMGVDLGKRKLIGIAPFAQHRGKEYPISHMKKVISELSKTDCYTVLLFGGGDRESTQLKSIAKKYNHVFSVAGKYSMRDELNIIKSLNLMISMDSGNAHLAAMFGVPVITLWGVTHPYAGFSPFNQDQKNALLSDRNQYPKIPTSIYGNKYPKGYEHAMNTIGYKEVLNKIEEVI